MLICGIPVKDTCTVRARRQETLLDGKTAMIDGQCRNTEIFTILCSTQFIILDIPPPPQPPAVPSPAIGGRNRSNP